MKTLKKYAPSILFILAIVSDLILNFTKDLELSHNQEIIFKIIGIVVWVLIQKFKTIKQETEKYLNDK